MALLSCLLLLRLLTTVYTELCTDKHCSYTFDLHWTSAMTYYDKETGKQYDVQTNNGQLELVSNGDGATDPVIVSPDDIITGDGLQRKVITINGHFPGPAIEVTEGAKVEVLVKNNLDEPTTIHWHGMHLYNEQWMDGVANITQCPIPPNSSFTYIFTASPGGLNWYHSHFLNQRDDGLYGVLFVQRWNINGPPVNLVLSQIFRYTAPEVRQMTSKIDEMEKHRMHADSHPTNLPEFEKHSVIINGRGRSNLSDEGLPWAKIKGQRGKILHLHIVHAGADYGLKVSVDLHKLMILAMDGFDIEPIQVDKFFIYPGESLEVALVNTTQQLTGSYWIRVQEVMLHASMSGHGHGDSGDGPRRPHHGHEHGHKGHMLNTNKVPKYHKRSTDTEPKLKEPKQHTKRSADTGEQTHHQRSPHHSHNTNHSHMKPHGKPGNHHPMHCKNGLAILSYDSDTVPTSTEQDCLKRPCRVFNCPEPLMSPGEDCILMNDVKGNMITNSEIWKKLKLTEEPDLTRVLNFMLTGHPHSSGSSVNGRKFRLPGAPLYSVNARQNECSKCQKCSHCTNIFTLPPGKVVQLTFTNLQSDQPLYMHHPIHLHGHVFGVMKVGYPTYDNVSKTFKAAPGMACRGRYCERVTRDNPKSLRQGRKPKKIKKRAPESHGLEVPLKNTILVPARGYVDVRIATDNPGFWFIHCHASQHLLNGMAAIIEVLPQIPPPPDFPTCGHEIVNYTSAKLISASTGALVSGNPEMMLVSALGICFLLKYVCI